MGVQTMVLEGPRFEIGRDDAAFPAALAAISNPPERLFGVGNPDVLREGLAVVGARRATPYGRSAAKRFAGRAAERGVVIISGGARGCDAVAHEAALAAGAPTVAFLGGGCNQIYPAENAGLFQRIISGGGAVVSEHPWDFPPQGYTFRARNRLIAGLARATLIVEKKSELVILENFGFLPSSLWGIRATSWDYAKAAHGDIRSIGSTKPAPTRESP